MWGIILGIYALMLWVLVILAWSKGYQEWKKNRATRLQTFNARVLDKRESGSKHLILFEFNGRQQELAADLPAYTAVRVGQEGTLNLKGGRFESFEPQSVDEAAQDLYRRMTKAG